MAIEPIIDRYHGFIFDGENSRDYGVYITEPAVFGSPERDVEYIAIPGRNGDYVRDNGRYKNITVTYKCAIGANADTDFNNAISDLRNMLGSKRGYKRLSDEINTGEYRMANFSAGVDVANINPRTGEFEVAFICKPQRFLTSGEEEVTLTPGDTTILENPTRMEASPILIVSGYGDIQFMPGRETITVENMGLGRVKIADGGKRGIPGSYTIPLASGYLNAGDPFTVDIDIVMRSDFRFGRVATSQAVTTGDIPIDVVATPGDTVAHFKASKACNFVWGTAGMYESTGEASVTATGTAGNYTVTMSASIGYIPAEGVIRVYVNGACTPSEGANLARTLENGDIYGESTKGIPGRMCVDLETGEAWVDDAGIIMGINDAIILPDKLPTLPPGENGIVTDSTFSSASIAPRWWKL